MSDIYSQAATTTVVPIATTTTTVPPGFCNPCYWTKITADAPWQLLENGCSGSCGTCSEVPDYITQKIVGGNNFNNFPFFIATKCSNAARSFPSCNGCVWERIRNGEWTRSNAIRTYGFQEPGTEELVWKPNNCPIEEGCVGGNCDPPSNSVTGFFARTPCSVPSLTTTPDPNLVYNYSPPGFVGRECSGCIWIASQDKNGVVSYNTYNKDCWGEIGFCNPGCKDSCISPEDYYRDSPDVLYWLTLYSLQYKKPRIWTPCEPLLSFENLSAVAPDPWQKNGEQLCTGKCKCESFPAPPDSKEINNWNCTSYNALPCSEGCGCAKPSCMNRYKTGEVYYAPCKVVDDESTPEGEVEDRKKGMGQEGVVNGFNTAVLNGKSMQTTIYSTYVDPDGRVKVVAVEDGKVLNFTMDTAPESTGSVIRIN